MSGRRDEPSVHAIGGRVEFLGVPADGTDLERRAVTISLARLFLKVQTLSQGGETILARRITLELKQAGISKRALGRALEQAGEPTSYPAVWRYLNKPNAKIPSGFIVATATILGVLPGWLLTGEGPRDQMELDNVRQVIR